MRREVPSGARGRLSLRGARGGGCPRPRRAVGAPFGRVFFSTGRRFFPLAPPAHCAAARNRMAAGLRRAGFQGGQGVCVGARRENGAKMRCWAPWLCRLFLAFEMGAALVEIPLGFSTCRKIWLFSAPHEPSGAGPSPAVVFWRGSRLPISHTKSLAAAEVPRRPQRLPYALIHATARALNAPRH